MSFWLGSKVFISFFHALLPFLAELEFYVCNWRGLIYLRGCMYAFTVVHYICCWYLYMLILFSWLWVLTRSHAKLTKEFNFLLAIALGFIFIFILGVLINLRWWVHVWFIIIYYKCCSYCSLSVIGIFVCLVCLLIMNAD